MVLGAIFSYYSNYSVLEIRPFFTKSKNRYMVLCGLEVGGLGKHIGVTAICF